MSADSSATKRQSRGRARTDQILIAAAATFGELGYESTTTNAIAAKAGVSPGSLYQFFKNKDDIAHTLAERYAEELSLVDLQGTSDASIHEAVHAAVDPIVAFNVAHPGFKALVARTDMPNSLRLAVAPVRDRLHRQVGAMVGALIPGLEPAELERTTVVVLHLVQGLMPLIVGASDEERPALVAELERSLVAYLEAVRAG
jgi:AcrR family transcriptional regulator